MVLLINKKFHRFHLIHILLLFLLIRIIKTEKKLVFVQLIHRHGERTPIKTYQSDPYKNVYKYFSAKTGQLTKRGKQQMYELGIWLRNRYKSFLPDIYSSDDIYVRSSDMDRTLMSAQLNLAGLYPPIGEDKWGDLNWQPIPVHTVQIKNENVLLMRKKCPQFYRELLDLLASPEFKIYEEKLQPIYKYVFDNTGLKLQTIQELQYLYNTLEIEENHGLELPEWTKQILPEMREWAGFSFSIKAYNTPLKRLKTGLLMNEIFTRFEKKSKGLLVPDYKMWIYSGHDTIMSELLTALQAFDPHCPVFAATLLFELLEENNTYYLSVLYKNGSNVSPISILGCDPVCPLELLLNLSQPYRLTEEQWEFECYAYLSYTDQDDVKNKRNNSGSITNTTKDDGKEIKNFKKHS